MEVEGFQIGRQKRITSGVAGWGGGSVEKGEGEALRMI
jgi:hypothetical protein